jgi:hypothetical protein
VLEAIYARPLNKALLLPGAVRPSERILVSLTTRFGIGGK